MLYTNAQHYVLGTVWSRFVTSNRSYNIAHCFHNRHSNWWTLNRTQWEQSGSIMLIKWPSRSLRSPDQNKGSFVSGSWSFLWKDYFRVLLFYCVLFVKHSDADCCLGIWGFKKCFHYLVLQWIKIEIMYFFPPKLWTVPLKIWFLLTDVTRKGISWGGKLMN